MHFKIVKGTNISHWLSQSEARGAERRNRFTRVDAERIKTWGFDHVRLPLDEDQMWDESGTREPEAFALLEQALDWCDELDLNAVVDLHILRSHYFNQKAEPELYTDATAATRFADLWGDLSAFLGKRTLDKVAYELLNEPVARKADDWNRVYRGAMAAVRRGEPERTVILGSNQFQNVRTFDELDVPDDPNVMLSFHFYDPFVLTHYRAPWTGIKDYAGPVHYPGPSVTEEDLSAVTDQELREALRQFLEPFTRDTTEALLAKPLAVSARTGRPLYCGEFGCLSTVPDAIRGAWYEDVVDIFRSHDIAYANWDYKGGFGLLDPKGNEVPAILRPVRGEQCACE